MGQKLGRWSKEVCVRAEARRGAGVWGPCKGDPGAGQTFILMAGHDRPLGHQKPSGA